jgi:holo-[acyl-carrier protein] synthase
LILGTGVDLIEIGRIAAATEDDRFNERVFTEAELGETKRLKHRLAGFFAAKEALLKAMGTGLAGFSWHEAEIRHNDKGAPYLACNGKIQGFLSEKKVKRIHLSISHCKEYAIAQVILEADEER